MRFLDAGMEEAEMDAFAKELDSSPEMRKQLDFEQSLRDGFALRNMTSLPGVAPANEDPAMRKKTGRITSIQKWLAIGAAAITAFILFTIFWQKPEKGQNVVNRNGIDTLHHKNSEPQTAINAPVEDSSKGVDLALLFNQYYKKDALPEQYPLFLAEALMDYESGNYKTLQQLSLNNLPQTRGAGDTDNKKNILQLGHYYKGLAFLQTNNTGDAIINLHWVLHNQPDKALQVKAKWYLTLAYVKENNKEKAAELCRSIIDSEENRVLVKNAAQILDKLVN